MAVGIGLDYGHDACIWRYAAQYLQVVFQRAEPDEGPSPEAHGYGSSPYVSGTQFSNFV